MGRRSWFSHRLGGVEVQLFKSLIMGNWSQFTSGDKSWYQFLVSCTVFPYKFGYLVVSHSFIMAYFLSFSLEVFNWFVDFNIFREFLKKLFSPDWDFLKEQLQLHSPTIVSSLKEVREYLKTTDHPVSPIKMHFKMDTSLGYKSRNPPKKCKILVWKWLMGHYGEGCWADPSFQMGVEGGQELASLSARGCPNPLEACCLSYWAKKGHLSIGLG